MKGTLPPLSWLRAFEASARHLSFTNAAEELGYTQAAISKQVKLLEQYLREPLFQRKPRSLVLTKVGAAYVPKVRESFERLAAGTRGLWQTDWRNTHGQGLRWLFGKLAGRTPAPLSSATSG